MQKRLGTRDHAVLTLLRSIRSHRALAGNAIVQRSLGSAKGPLFNDLAGHIPAVVEGLLDELAASGAGRRRFTILRRSDVACEKHSAIAGDLGLSRSQFYRDLQTARAEFAEALENRLTASSATLSDRFAKEYRITAIDTLRSGGRFREARDVASSLSRDLDAAGAVQALCLRAEIENEVGAFGSAVETAHSARSLLAHVDDEEIRELLGVECALVEMEARQSGAGMDESRRRSLLIQGLRRNGEVASPRRLTLLVKALVQDASIYFGHDMVRRASAAIEEACALVTAVEHADRRLAVDVRIRASGIRALDPHRVATEFNQSGEIAEMGRRFSDARTLRVGMQMMAAHLFSLGRLDEARAHAAESHALIELFGSDLDRIIVLSNLARIEVHRGDGKAALDWIRLARDVGCDVPVMRKALDISETEALVLAKETDRAASLSRELDRDIDDWQRLQGRAKVARAAVLAATGHQREACVYSEEAVELSRGTGGIPLQMRALDLNAKLTGNPRSRKALRELGEALTA